MNCRDCLEILESAPSGSPDGSLAPGIREHLEQCASCRDEYAAMAALGRTLDAWKAPLPPTGLARRTSGILREAARFEQPAVPWWRKMALGVALPAAATAALVFAATLAVVNLSHIPETETASLAMRGGNAVEMTDQPQESITVWADFNNGVLTRVRNPGTRMMLSNAIADIVLDVSATNDESTRRNP